MGARGPKPTPTKILAMRGSWRATSPDRAGEPQYEPVEPEMPAGLGVRGKAEWKRVVPQLAAKRILAEVDRTNLWLMCKALDEHAQADQAVRKHGLLVDGATGNKVLNPAVHERQRAWARYVKLSAAFGMTSSDRTKVKAGDGDKGPKDGGSGIAKFLGRQS